MIRDLNLSPDQIDHYSAMAMADLCSGYRALESPHLIPVAESAGKNLVMVQPGMQGGLWSAEETPYMVEPMNMLTSRKHDSVVFAGPARTGKTAGLLLAWLAHNVINDPGDMLFIQMTKDKARDFSKTDVTRAMDNSPNIDAMKSTRMVDSNTFDTMFKHGMWLKIAWPTVTNVSGSTFRYVAITDIDRIENAENVDGEGPLFELGKKRTTTFMSRGMTLVESSPGKPVIDPMWKPSKPHEAPPLKGVLGIYNTSDRRRWYWKCPHCSSRFEAKPGLELFGLPSDRELLDTVRLMDTGEVAQAYGARIIPPCCKEPILSTAKYAMNLNGRWVAEGQYFDENDVLQGTAMKSKTAGYWLGGVAAAFQTWPGIIENYLKGMLTYVLSGSEETLKTSVNLDQGMPYTSRHLIEASEGRTTPLERAVVGMQRYVVPDWCRTLLAAVDVQGGSNAKFVVQLHAVGPFLEQQLVDRFEIKLSKRPGMGQEFAPIDPAGYPEDWHLITEKIVMATWRTPFEGREIRPHCVIVDTGGEGKKNGGEGVSMNAYAWFRRLRALGISSRVRLYKGNNAPTAAVIKDTLVGRRSETDKGDIPLFLCNPHLLSDAVDAGMRRTTPGPGYYHFPLPRHPQINPDGWLEQAFFDELAAEIRNEDGIWEKVRLRNESFDLCRMIMAGICMLGLDKLRDWSKVPDWLMPLEQNIDVITAHVRRQLKEVIAAEIAAPLVTSREVALQRRFNRPRGLIASPYLS